MLRSFLISLSKASWARKIVTRWSFAWKAASRFVAGEKLEDAIQAVKELTKRGSQRRWIIWANIPPISRKPTAPFRT